MSNLTFLTQEQCFGREQLKVLQKKGTKAAITDFSILLGGYISNCYIDGESSLEGRTGYYWTKSDDGDNDVRVVSDYGRMYLSTIDERDDGARHQERCKEDQKRLL